MEVVFWSLWKGKRDEWCCVTHHTNDMLIRVSCLFYDPHCVVAEWKVRTESVLLSSTKKRTEIGIILHRDSIQKKRPSSSWFYQILKDAISRDLFLMIRADLYEEPIFSCSPTDVPCFLSKNNGACVGKIWKRRTTKKENNCKQEAQLFSTTAAKTHSCFGAPLVSLRRVKVRAGI